MPCFLAVLQIADQRKAVDPRHRDIRNDEVWGVLQCPKISFFRIGHGHDLVAFGREVFFDYNKNKGIIIDRQYGFRHNATNLTLSLRGEAAVSAMPFPSQTA